MAVPPPPLPPIFELQSVDRPRLNLAREDGTIKTTLKRTVPILVPFGTTHIMSSHLPLNNCECEKEQPYSAFYDSLDLDGQREWRADYTEAWMHISSKEFAEGK